MVKYNRMMRKACAVLLVLAVSFMALPLDSYSAVQTEADQKAEALNHLGLLYGTQNGYELYRPPTKLETVFMIVHLMGLDSEAKSGAKDHPFNDVPDWADSYVAYVYQNGHMTGVSENEFGSEKNCSREEFLTVLLGTMGYSKEASSGREALTELAGKLGLTGEVTGRKLFTRDEMVRMTWNALAAKVNVAEESTLADALMKKGMFTAAAYEEAKAIVAAAPRDEKTVYLTFDDGPGLKVTPRILETLRAEGVPATFFVLGSLTDKNPQMLRQIYESGHQIANHTYGHDYDHLYAAPENLIDEIEKTNVSINNALGFDYGNRMFRFPGGASIRGQNFRDAVNAAGYEYYGWNCSGEDSVSPKGATKEEILHNVKTTAGDKKEVTVLLHDNDAKSTTADALPEIIRYFKERGYVFRALGQL